MFWDFVRCLYFFIVEMERKINKKKPKIVIPTEIEALVESFFLEEKVMIVASSLLSLVRFQNCIFLDKNTNWKLFKVSISYSISWEMGQGG